MDWEDWEVKQRFLRLDHIESMRFPFDESCYFLPKLTLYYDQGFSVEVFMEDLSKQNLVL